MNEKFSVTWKTGNQKNCLELSAIPLVYRYRQEVQRFFARKVNVNNRKKCDAWLVFLLLLWYDKKDKNGGDQVRRELFHMERDVLNVGDRVTITEGELPFSYYYTVVPALAMSGNYKNLERIKSREGVVVGKERHDSTYHIYIEFEK